MVSSKLLAAFILSAVCVTVSAQATSCTLDNAISLEAVLSDTPPTDIQLPDGVEDHLERVEEAMDILGKIGKRNIGIVKRATSCTPTETCFSVQNQLALCINPLTADYHVEGEVGNLITGDYTNADGTKGNINSDIASFTSSLAQESVTKTANAASTTSNKVVETGTGGAVQSISSTKVAGVSASVNAAASTLPSPTGSARPTGGAAEMKVGSGVVVVAAGVVLGMIL